MTARSVTCPDGVVREITGILTVPGEPDRYETSAGAWSVSECEPAFPAPVEKPATKRRNYTRELIKALARGAVIECAVAPYEGTAVAHRPRSVGDPHPWVLASGDREGFVFRYTGRECRLRALEEEKS